MRCATRPKPSTVSLLADAASRPLSRLFSLRHEFPTEWNRFVNAAADR